MFSGKMKIVYNNWYPVVIGNKFLGTPSFFFSLEQRSRLLAM